MPLSRRARREGGRIRTASPETGLRPDASALLGDSVRYQGRRGEASSRWPAARRCSRRARLPRRAPFVRRFVTVVRGRAAARRHADAKGRPPACLPTMAMLRARVGGIARPVGRSCAGAACTADRAARADRGDGGAHAATDRDAHRGPHRDRRGCDRGRGGTQLRGTPAGPAGRRDRPERRTGLDLRGVPARREPRPDGAPRRRVARLVVDGRRAHARGDSARPDRAHRDPARPRVVALRRGCDRGRDPGLHAPAAAPASPGGSPAGSAPTTRVRWRADSRPRWAPSR